MDEKLDVCICMGSSCFARGNEANLAAVERYIAERGLGDLIELTGTLCIGCCSQGPNVRIGGTVYHGVDEGTVLDLLAEHLAGAREGAAR